MKRLYARIHEIVETRIAALREIQGDGEGSDARETKDEIPPHSVPIVADIRDNPWDQVLRFVSADGYLGEHVLSLLSFPKSDSSPVLQSLR